MKVLKIDFEVNGAFYSDIIVAILSDIGFYAFEENDTVLSGYVMEKDFDENLVKEETKNFTVNFTKSKIENKNWNEKWESEFKPVLIDDFVAVKANFHPSIHSVKFEIVVTPKMSFGTGHHPSTYLMIREMKDLYLKNKNVLDFGTGTGILAILAEKMGGQVTAIDNDESSISNANENIEINNCKNIKVIKTDSPLGLGKFNIVLANINTNVLLNNITSIKTICLVDNLVLLSGFLFKDVKTLQDKFLMAGFVILKIVQEGDWSCILLHVPDS